LALYYDLKVFKDVYQLILKVFENIQGFPREYKYTLGQDMKRDVFTFVRSIYRANKAKSKTEGFFGGQFFTFDISESIIFINNRVNHF